MDLLKPDFGVFFWQLVSILGVVFILKKFAFKIILDILEKREDRINDSIKNAKKIELDLQNIEILKKQNEEDLRNIKSKMLQEVNTLKKELIEKAKSEAQQVENDLISKAKVEIEHQKELFKEQYNTELACTAIKISEKLLNAELANENKSNDFINLLIKDISSDFKR